MKRKFLISYILLGLAALSFADSYKPPLTGSLNVAQGKELPTGKFIKVSGYLPGDSIEIFNESNGSRLKLLNLGDYNAGNDLVLISKQAADDLGLKDNDNYKVKVNVRNGSADKEVTGSITVFLDTAVAEVKQTVTPVIEEYAYEEEVYYDEEESGAIVEERPLEDAPETIAAVSDPITDGQEVVESPEETQEDILAELDEANLVAESIIAESIASPSESYDIYVDDLPQDEIVSEFTIDESDNSELYIEEPLVVAENTAKSDLETSDVAIDIAMQESSPKEEYEGEVKVPSAEKSSEEIAYAPIILVPVEDQAPVEAVEEKKSGKETSDSNVAAKNKRDDSVLILEPEPVVRNETKETSVASAKTTKDNKDFSSYIIKNEKELKKSSYYIQIATLANEDNITNTLNKYNKYPVVLLASTKGYKVLVGPLTVDEYGAVFEKFKAYGYKDAFVKKTR